MQLNEMQARGLNPLFINIENIKIEAWSAILAFSGFRNQTPTRF